MVRQVRIPRGGLNLRVPRQLADSRQAFADQHAIAGIGVAKIMDADILPVGVLPNSPSRMLRVGQVTAPTIGRMSPFRARSKARDWR